jgi:hypothetical protein
MMMMIVQQWKGRSPQQKTTGPSRQESVRQKAKDLLLEINEVTENYAC